MPITTAVDPSRMFGQGVIGPDSLQLETTNERTGRIWEWAILESNQ